MPENEPLPDEARGDEMTESHDKAVTRPRRRHNRSTLAPVGLITAGVLFLLVNIGAVDALNWDAAWRYWPLALIFLGLNILAMQLRPPKGTVIGLLVALAAAAVFSWLLLSGPPGL